jgi:hypothetical protein
MAVVINITPPEATPTVLTLTPTTGGTLAAGDYYVRVCGAGVNSDNLLVLETQTTATRSCPSDEVMVTITAPNNAISCGWTGSSGYYNVYCRKSTESVGYVSRRYIPNGVTSATCNTNSYTILNLTRGLACDTFVISGTVNALPMDVDPNLGTIIVNVDSTNTSNITYDDVYTAVNGAGYAAYLSWNTSDFVLKGAFQVLSGATGTANFLNFRTSAKSGTGNRFWFLQGNFLSLSSTFTTTGGGTLGGISLMLWSQKCFQSLKNMTCTNMVVLGGTWAQISIPGLTTSVAELYIPTDTGDTSRMTVRGANRILVSKNISDMSLLGNYVCPNADGLTFTNIDCLAFRDGDVAITSCKMVRCQTYATFDYWVTLINNATEMDFIDCVFSSTTGVIRNTPIIRYNNANCLTAFLKWGYTINVNVKDENGNNVQGVSCVLTDNTGSTLFTQTTDASGNITEQECYVGRIDDGTPMGSYPSIVNSATLYTPFITTNSKTGFKTQAIKSTPTKAIQESITLATEDSINLSRQIKGSMFQ